jgi:hypothetical protein
MGDYVNGSNGDKEQGLFVFSPEGRYSPDSARTPNFSFFSDIMYTDLSMHLLNEYVT